MDKVTPLSPNDRTRVSISMRGQAGNGRQPARASVISTRSPMEAPGAPPMAAFSLQNLICSLKRSRTGQPVTSNQRQSNKTTGAFGPRKQTRASRLIARLRLTTVLLATSRLGSFLMVRTRVAYCKLFSVSSRFPSCSRAATAQERPDELGQGGNSPWVRRSQTSASWRCLPVNRSSASSACGYGMGCAAAGCSGCGASQHTMQ